jgi:protein required for attachment to host cells
MKKEVWIVVANSSQARFLRLEKNRKLVELETLQNPEARIHSRDLYSDRPGRTFQSMGQERSALQQKVDPKEQEIIDFAKEVCEHIESARARGYLERLYLAANPAFLGHLRQFLSPTTLRLVESEIDKDITHLKAVEIEEYLAL